MSAAHSVDPFAMFQIYGVFPGIEASRWLERVSSALDRAEKCKNVVLSYLHQELAIRIL